jgi:hypothetical protein
MSAPWQASSGSAAPVRDARAARASLVFAAAGLSFSAALVHASVIGVHFREYWLFGLFFAIVTPLQVLWAGLAARRPDDRRLLRAGAIGNLAIAVIWAISRVFGLPIGPHAFEPEAVGVKDLLASYAEVGVAVCVALALRESRAPSWIPGVAWVLAAACLLSAFLPGH